MTRFAVAMMLAACGPSARELCERNGGQWLEVNCHDETQDTCIYFDMGNGVTVPICGPVTSTVCDHMCRNAAAEDTRK